MPLMFLRESRFPRPISKSCLSRIAISTATVPKRVIAKKEGLPLRAGLLVIPNTLDWCGGGDLNPYALRR